MNGWHVPWSWTAEGVRGIEVGIKLPVMPLASGTGKEVICHHDLLQSGPRKWGDRVEPGKDITRGESVKGILLAGHEECGKSWLVGLERMATGEIWHMVMLYLSHVKRHGIR